MSGERCPYREHAPAAPEEHEVWAIVRSLPLRYADGRAVGLDVGLGLALAEARGLDAAVAAELLPAAGAGFIEAMMVED